MRPGARIVLILLTVVVAVAVVVFIRRERAPSPVRIGGKTVGPNGAALPDVRVTLEVSPSGSEEETAIERVETQSDARGNFSIDFQGHWRRASYRLEAQKPGFERLSIDDADSLRNPVTLRFRQSQ
ncbi:MAG TPA: carboxypeptidase-like regulatory domain-containing protein [Thermoanaerobaculia bacterium]|nr:carboxypeptidase-like regulatory domain-containing protein [Thermoanaerobaculia bacterium]